MTSQPPRDVPSIVPVLLAAGEGRRMGGPKAILDLDGLTFLDRCLAVLTRPGVTSCVVVTGFQAERVASRVPTTATAVHNPRPEDGMLSSLLVGLDEAERRGGEAILVHLVDHPFVAPETVDAVVAALQQGARIAVPSHDGRRGHPVGFAREVWPALRDAPPSRGARALLVDHPDWVVHVPGDAGCRADMDAPEDLDAWRATAATTATTTRCGPPAPGPSGDAPGRSR